jgi:hypothetical protein
MRVVTLAEEAAAAAVNFRLLRPALAGLTYDPAALTVRLEGPPYALHPDPGATIWSHWAGLHNSSVHFHLGTPYGTLRCKQFLYDLGPLSTLDHAALYDHRQDQMRLHPLDAERVAWTGYDYQDRRALSLLAWGTNLELRELDGEHTEEYLVEVARSLQPVPEGQLAPLAERSYWARHPRYDRHMCRLAGYRPPSGLWRWRWPWLAVDHRWQTALPALPLPGLAAQGGEVFAPAWTFDSACVFGDPDRPGEVQLFFQPANGLGHAQLWLRAFWRDRQPLAEPEGDGWPELESHSGFRAFVRTRLATPSGQRIHVASRTLDHGPHDALWWQGDHGYLLQITAAVRHDLGQVVALLAGLLGEAVAAG